MVNLRTQKFLARGRHSALRLAPILALSIATITLGSTTLPAQDYPVNTIRMIVPFAPGAGVDTMARGLALELGKKWNQTIVVENLTGAGATLGSKTVARAKPDGYTLLFSTDQTITAPNLIKDVGYDPLVDLAPVTMITEASQMVIANPSLPANTIPELVAYAKKNPGRLNYGSFGLGSATHLFFEAFKAEAKIDIAHVPYRGQSLVAAAITAGEVQVALGGTQSTTPLFQDGKVKILAIDSAERHPLFSQVPTMIEAGYPNVNARPWYGLFTTGGTPRPVVEKIQRDVAEVLSSPTFVERMLKPFGFISGAMSPDKFAELIKVDNAHKSRLIQMVGIKPE